MINNDNAFLNQSNQGYRVWALTFNTFSTRNAGFSTMDLGSGSGLNPLTTVIQGLMMFIGSGPGSTAGGLRTTTFVIIVVTTWATIRGKKIHMFNRTISDETIKKALTIFISSIVLIFVGVVIISISESIANPNKFSILDISFLTLSAYGTTGLSTFGLSNISFMTKLILIIIMFVGQLGMSTSLSQVHTKKKLVEKTYIVEEISLG